MKKYMNNKVLSQSVLSLLALGIFILLAIGSVAGGHYFPAEIDREYKGKGIYEETVLLHEKKMTFTGEQDSEGRYQGPYTIVTGGVWDGSISNKEEAHFINGLRHGESKYFNSDGKLTHTQKYNMGVKVGLLKSTTETKAATSAYEVLQDKYPWFSHQLNGFGFEDAYLKAYLDTVELLLTQTARDEEYFNDYFDMITSDLEETPYDSLIVLNESMSAYLGLQAMKNSELRLALIKRFRSDGNSTYPIIQTTYPNYLLYMNEESVENEDFETFCHVLDSCMDSRGVLDPVDTFFIDSVDLWFSESLIIIYESDEYDLEASYVNHHPSQVASYALSLMIDRFENQGDILKRSAREAYILNKGRIRLPVVTTVFSRNISLSSVNLKGYILENGGEEVTASGIVWASHYNPTVEDQSVPAQAGAASFTLTIEGLTEGNTYYARSYATNSAGTAYGNCIGFVATAPTGIVDQERSDFNFSIYPNPASTVATFSFFLESPERISLSIFDMSGRLVHKHDPGTLFQGKNQIQLDLSDLPNGLYTCLVRKNGAAAASQNIFIYH